MLSHPIRLNYFLRWLDRDKLPAFHLTQLAVFPRYRPIAAAAPLGAAIVPAAKPPGPHTSGQHPPAPHNTRRLVGRRCEPPACVCPFGFGAERVGQPYITASAAH